jgi:effector-binding domain-containing protein
MTSSPTPSGYPDLGATPLAEVTVIDAPAVPTAVVRSQGVAMASIAGLFDAAFGSAFPALFARGVAPAGAPFALYTRLTEGAEAVADVEIGFPLSAPLDEQLGEGAFDAGDLRIELSELPAGATAVVSHLGAYDGLGEAWGRLMGEIAGMGHAPGLPFWECYVTEPSPDMDPATLRTDLYCPVGRPDDAA